MFLLAYRTEVNETIDRTPAGIVFGLKLRLPVDLLHDRPPEELQALPEYASHLQKRLKAVRSRFQQESGQSKTRYNVRGQHHMVLRGLSMVVQSRRTYERVSKVTEVIRRFKIKEVKSEPLVSIHEDQRPVTIRKRGE